MSDFTFPRRLTMEDDIDGFDCGLPVVNNWLRNQLKNAGRQHTAVAYATFSNGVLAGFYTLSAYGINHTEANGWLKRNSPDPIPAILLGMLGVEHRKEVNRPSRTGLAPHAGQPIPLASHSAAVRFDWKMPWLPLMPVACHMCFRLIVSRRRVPTV